jgi:cation diffusion facilitator CzcD-associated flavoprotein CzcO
MESNPGFTLLEEQARHDLERLNYPGNHWVPPRDGPDGRPMIDVLIVGAGMCGQGAAFGLMRDGVRNIRVIEREPPGREGPWNTFARMPTLRSPKHLASPDLGVGSLTFRAWYEGRHGADGWQKLYKIGRLEWRDYLLWVRRMTQVPVENGTALKALEPHGDHLVATLSGRGGRETVHARKVVLALGREGSGALRWPVFPSFDRASQVARARIFHASSEFDFARFKDKRVAVLGVGATGFDNAGTALEGGAAEVVMFARRTHLPQVNKSKWTSFPGFFHGYIALSDASRWKFLNYVWDEQVPPPFESVLRCDCHPNFRLRLGTPWLDLEALPDGVRIVTAQGEERFDYAILATGFDVDLMQRPELAAFRDHVVSWADRVGAAEAARHPESARFPYLGDGFEFVEKAPGACPAARQVHMFNWGAAMSHGQIAGDIPGLNVGVDRLVQAICRDFFLADEERFFETLKAHAEPELKATRYYLRPTG